MTTFEELPESVGAVVIGEPFTILQEDVAYFQKATWLDRAYPEDMPEFPETLVEGFLLLALLDPVLRFAEAEQEDGATSRSMWGLNYGLDSVRFISPVHIGDRVESRFETLAVEPKDLGFKLLRRCVFKVEGHERPALTADWWSFVLPRGTVERRRRQN